ncbi:MAG: ChbG/HpnK family deacetylase [Akkermansiaceae bacterium]|nr:ChbG/HpnK family deacetylase [Akkermansiaceae bacterium]
MNHRPNRTPVICADDYGMNLQITAGILRLARQEKIQALSCMVNAPDWQDHADNLTDLPASIKIGLHFDLTHPFTPRHRPLHYWIRQALCGKIDAALVTDALHSQWNAFVETTGRSPDHFDSHQHVHTFPIIRHCLLNFIKEKAPAPGMLPVRDPSPLMAPYPFFKSKILRLVARGFTEELGPYLANQYFGGLYSLKPRMNFPSLLNSWVTNAAPGTLIMCHPGEPSDDPTDPISDTRAGELQALLSFESTNNLALQR